MVSPELVPPAPSISGTGSGASRGPGREAGCVDLASISNLQRGRLMKLQSLMLRNSLLILTSVLALPAFRAAAQSKPDAAQSQEKQPKPQQGLRELPRNDAGLEAAQEGPEFLRRRQDWFFKPRAFPIGFIPQGARERALQQKAQMYQREGRLSPFAAQPGSGFL